MMRRLLGASVVVTVALVALSSLGAGATPDATAMTTAKVKAAGISLKYPRSWILVPLTKQGLAAQEKILSKKNPKLAALVAGTDVSQFKLRAFDPTGSGQNVGVQFIQGQGSPTSLSDFNSVVPGFKADGATVLDTKAVRISGKTAYRLDMTLPVKLPDGSVVVARVGEFALPEGDNTAAVVASAANNDAGVALINSILASVRHV